MASANRQPGAGIACAIAGDGLKNLLLHGRRAASRNLNAVASFPRMAPPERKIALSIKALSHPSASDAREYMSDPRGSITSIGEMVGDFGFEREDRRRKKGRRDRDRDNGYED